MAIAVSANDIQCAVESLLCGYQRRQVVSTIFHNLLAKNPHQTVDVKFTSPDHTQIPVGPVAYTDGKFVMLATIQVEVTITE